MAGLSSASPVETILDKENFTLEELLDEDEIIQECKALNSRLINFLREKDQVEQLLRYIIEEAPPDAEKRRSVKFPFIACEIFTCEVDIILRTLVEDEELMNLLFSFLEPNNPHSTQLAGYFSKVVVCLLLRKAVPLMNYIQAHPATIKQLVDLIGITSIMEVLIRLIGADEHMYANHTDAMHWVEDTDVLELILDKFSSSDSPEVHANAAETLCAITRFAPPGLSAKICSPSFIERLFSHALEESRPKSVLVNLLSICISLLDPKRFTTGPYHSFNRQLNHGSNVVVHPEIIEAMLGNLGALLKMLDVSSAENTLPTTYGKLQPPLGKHRLKIVEFIAVLVNVGSQSVEKELICLEAVQRLMGFFFEYPYNNFVHHHIESIIITCLESKNASLIEYILGDCNLIGKVLEVEGNTNLSANSDKPTLPAEGRTPPRVGNIGHLTRISNKLVQLANNSSEIQKFLQENEWTEWQANVLSKRNAVENVYQWACGRPTALQDRTRDSDDDDYQDRDYDVAALANNLSQAFRYGIYNQEEIDEPHRSLERDDEDVYFDDESAEVVISSLRLGDDQESGSLFTNSNWFAFDDDRVSMERSAGALTSSPDNEGDSQAASAGDGREVINVKSSLDPFGTPELDAKVEDSVSQDLSDDQKQAPSTEVEKLPELVEWEEASETIDEVSPEKSLEDVNEVCSGEPPSAASVGLEPENGNAETLAVKHDPSLGSETAEAAHSDESEKGEAAEGLHPIKLPVEPTSEAPVSKVNGELSKEAGDGDEAGEVENVPGERLEPGHHEGIIK
ncbi:hypothetical protein MLD38_016669 [Melastoma candidum]|uniref:Uncharacterized protein n=1 Tax=Melastoma candidum TaxID=119954 RepID=A0ACB9QPB5_9MYRT|nr:hypothetical protein MLD38_016669 [Melastoma candidum]